MATKYKAPIVVGCVFLVLLAASGCPRVLDKGAGFNLGAIATVDTGEPIAIVGKTVLTV